FAADSIRKPTVQSTRPGPRRGGPQACRAEAVLRALLRHRQPVQLGGAPAIPTRAAVEGDAAACAGETAPGRRIGLHQAIMLRPARRGETSSTGRRAGAEQ